MELNFEKSMTGSDIMELTQQDPMTGAMKSKIKNLKYIKFAQSGATECT